jgi:hypothetical protein
LSKTKAWQATAKSVSTEVRDTDAEGEDISTISKAMANETRVIIGKGKVVEEKA